MRRIGEREKSEDKGAVRKIGGGRKGGGEVGEEK